MKLWQRIKVYEILSNKLKIDFNKSGKEFTGWFVYEGKKITRATVPRGRNSLTPKTQNSIRMSLRLNSLEFNGLMDCPINYDGYVDILRNKSLLPRV
jgi:hypothetical protein